MKTELYNRLVEISSIKSTKIKSNNLKVGVNVYNVIGDYTSDANAYSSDIEVNTAGYVNAVKINGILPVHSNESIGLLPVGSAVANDISSNMEMSFVTNTVVNIDNSSINVQDTILKNSAVLSVPYGIMANALNLNPLHIRKDVSILGVVGNYDASTEFSGVKLEPIEYSESQIPLLNLITEISNLDMNLGTNLRGYFSYLPKLIYVSNILMPNITNGSDMFSYDYSLQYISNINMYNDTTINSVSLHNMFSYCSNLVSIDNDCKFPKEINGARFMFMNCINLKYINTPIYFINTNTINNAFCNCSNLEDFSNIIFDYDNSKCFNTLSFYGCTNINLYTVHNVNWLNCSGSHLLKGCTNVTTDDIEACMPNGVYISNMTFENTGINRIPNIPFVSSGYNSSNLFAQCDGLTTINLGTDFFNNFPNIINLTNLFSYCYNLSSVDLDFGNSSVKNVYGLVRNCYNLKYLNLSGNNLNSIPWVATNCNTLTNVNISLNSAGWDRNLFYSFSGCSNLVSVNISDYNDNFVETGLYSLNFTFDGCRNLKNVSGLNNMLSNIKSFCNTFNYCSNLVLNGQLNINIYDMDYDYGCLFYSCPNVTVNANVYFYYNSVREVQNVYIFRLTNVQHINIVCNGSIASKSYTSWIGPFVGSCDNLKTLNSSFDINSSSTASFSICNYCFNVTDINVDIAFNSIYNISMSNFLYYCPNLVNLNINLTSNNFIASDFKVKNCPNLSNQSLDNILGFLVNINYTGSNKTLNYMGFNTYNNTIWETLPNYANFINAGYSVGY